VSLVELVKACGIALTGSGDNLMGPCPLHADQTLSRVVSPSKNVWHCLGECRAGVAAPVRLRTDRRNPTGPPLGERALSPPVLRRCSRTHTRRRIPGR
jgi:hypothetical protein